MTEHRLPPPWTVVRLPGGLKAELQARLVDLRGLIRRHHHLPGFV